MKDRLLILVLTCQVCAIGVVEASEQWLFIASPAKPAVIYRTKLNLETGAMSAIEVAADEVSTGFMALHPTLPILYAGTSEQVAKGEPNGFVRSYQIDPQSGELTQTGMAPTKDSGTTHIEVAANGKFLAVCHYGGEGTSILSLDEAGNLQQTPSVVVHSGSSVDPKRQTRPHPHGVAISRDGRFVCVADLGNDHVEVFPVSEKGEISTGKYWEAAPGAGPRHVAFHPEKPWLYCINELDSTLSVLNYDATAGGLTEIQTVSTLPADYEGNNTTAEVVVHPSGKFVYGSNRGHNSTAVFAIKKKTGKLKLVEHEPTQGDHPRFVGLDPTGEIYLAANMNTNSVVSFQINPQTGELDPTGNVLEVPRPMCVLFVPAN